MTAEQSSPLHRHERWTMPMDGPRRAAFDRFNRAGRWPWWMLDAVRVREQTVSPESIEALAEITLPDQDGRPVRFRDLWREGPAVIVWLRQFGCPFCRSYAVRLNRARAGFAAAGARLALIGQGTPDDAARFRRHLRIELQVLADADRVTYLWAGTKIATLDELVSPVVVGRALLAMARDRVVIGHNTADEAQLGGSIVVGPGGEIALAHISRDASDMASLDELLTAVTTSSAKRSVDTDPQGD